MRQTIVKRVSENGYVFRLLACGHRQKQGMGGKVNEAVQAICRFCKAEGRKPKRKRSPSLRTRAVPAPVQPAAPVAPPPPPVMELPEGLWMKPTDYSPACCFVTKASLIPNRKLYSSCGIWIAFYNEGRVVGEQFKNRCPLCMEGRRVGSGQGRQNDEEHRQAAKPRNAFGPWFS